MKKNLLPILLLLLLLLQSCASKKDMLYLQDLNRFSNSNITYVMTKIQPNDILKIDVTDLNPLVAAPFNNNVGFNSANQSVQMMELSGYLVSSQGNITMPILNEIFVGGLSPSSVESKIKERLVKEGYLVNPTVTVRVLNSKFTVLGEVNAPGVYSFTEQTIGLLEALGMAKDLTYSGLRKDIQLIREVNGKRFIYHIDLTTAAWMSNPDFQIRQNDVIIVTPNGVKVNSGGLIRDPVQVLALATSILTLVLLITDH